MKAPAADCARPAVAGAIVTYFPDEQFTARLAAIARETRLVIVVDNSAEECVRRNLREACGQHGARLIENSGNRGVGAALNQALAAIAPEVEWIIAFDQDSTPAAGFREALRQAASAGDDRLSVLGASWFDEARPDVPARHLQRHPILPFCFVRRAATGNFADVTCVITSGSLFHVPTVRTLGGFAEDLFLDLVDTELCLRAHAAGFAVRVAGGAHMMHRRGAKRAIRRLGRTWWPAFMPPQRLHYLFRNRVLVFRRVGWRFPHWCAFEVVYAAKILTEILLFEDRKAAKFAACAVGTWHGLLGRSGKIT